MITLCSIFGRHFWEYYPNTRVCKYCDEVYRSHDILLFPAFADAAPNTVLEARACGLAVECVNPVGGTEELLDVNLDISLERMCREYYELFKSLMPPI